MMANRWATEGIICQYALKTNSVVTYINYRLSPEYHHPTAEHDCYDCLMVVFPLSYNAQFMMEHHEEYHFDLNKIVLMGDSAGVRSASASSTALASSSTAVSSRSW